MKPGIYAKASGDGGGNICGGGVGGGMSRLGKGPQSKQKMYDASIILSLDKDNQFFIMKNRYGEHGSATMDGALDIIANMLTQAVFDGSMEMFQETMKMKIVEALKPIVSGNNIIPEGDLNENTLQRESGGHGSGHNTLLQRFVQLRR